MIAAAAAIPYEDIRIKTEDWPSIKPGTPLGQVPYIEINAPSLREDYKLPQSIAIARYFAKLGNISGRNILEQAETDAVVDTVLELRNAFFSANICTNCTSEEQNQQLEDFIQEKYLKNLEIVIKMYGKNGYSVGNSLTWADLVIYDSTDLMLLRNATNEYEDFPLIKRVRCVVEANDRVAAYLKKRP